MANLRIIPRNFHDEATLTASTEATGYPGSNTQNCIRSRVWRSTSTATATISGVLTSWYRANFLGMFRHNGPGGGTVRLQLYDEPDWTVEVYDSTALNFSQALTGREASYDWGLPGISTDPYALQAPYWLYFPEWEFISYKLTFSSLPAAQTYWEASRIFLGKYHTFANNPNYGAADGRSDLTDSNRSRGGSLRTNSGASFATAAMEMGFMSEDDAIFCRDIMRYCGTGKDIVASLYPEEASTRERDNLINGKFVSLDAIGRQVSYLTKRFQIQEV